MGPTPHNPNEVLLGTVGSNDREIACYNADPAVFKAGLAVRNNAGALSLSTGMFAGVSIGKNFIDNKKTSVCSIGNRVPLLLQNEGDASELEVEDLTFAAKDAGAAGDEISVALVDGGTAGSEVVSVVGKAISVSMDDGVSTATQLKAALDGSPAAMALIGVTITGTGSDAQAAFAATNLAGGSDDFDWAVVGAPVRVNASGKAVSSGGTLTGAVVLESLKDGVEALGAATTVPCMLISMPGGL